MNKRLRSPLQLGAVLLVLGAMLQPAQAAYNCLSWENFFRADCRDYRYDTIPVYFKDEQGLEHQAQLHRVLNDQRVLHVDIDFIGNDALVGQSVQKQLIHVAWAFRQAAVNEQLYAKRLVSTDVTSSNPAGNAVEKTIAVSDNIANLIERFEPAKSGLAVLQDIQVKQQMPSRYLWLKATMPRQTEKAICEMRNEHVYCDEIKGRVLETATSVDVKFEDLRHESILHFQHFLYEHYKREDNICFPVSGSCTSASDVKCSLTWRCDKL